MVVLNLMSSMRPAVSFDIVLLPCSYSIHVYFHSKDCGENYFKLIFICTCIYAIVHFRLASFSFYLFLPIAGITQLRFKPAYNPYTEPSMEVFSYHEGKGILVHLYTCTLYIASSTYFQSLKIHNYAAN